MTGFGIRPAALPSWLELHSALLDLTTPTPCQSAPGVWTSDDPAERATASRACIGCPVILLCDRFARLNRESSNVWAGIDRTPTRGRPAAPSKESA